jgi:hypothetical protein
MVCWEKKSMGPVFSHGFITFAAPTFSIRIERLDSQVCSYGSHTPGSVVHIFPSTVPPSLMLYVKGAAVTSWTWRLGMSVGSVLDAQGSNAPFDCATPQETQTTAILASSRNDFSMTELLGGKAVESQCIQQASKRIPEEKLPQFPEEQPWNSWWHP